MQNIAEILKNNLNVFSRVAIEKYDIYIIFILIPIFSVLLIFFGSGAFISLSYFIVVLFIAFGLLFSNQMIVRQLLDGNGDSQDISVRHKIIENKVRFFNQSFVAIVLAFSATALAVLNLKSNNSSLDMDLLDTMTVEHGLPRFDMELRNLEKQTMPLLNASGPDTFPSFFDQSIRDSNEDRLLLSRIGSVSGSDSVENIIDKYDIFIASASKYVELAVELQDIDSGTRKDINDRRSFIRRALNNDKRNIIGEFREFKNAYCIFMESNDYMNIIKAIREKRKASYRFISGFCLDKDVNNDVSKPAFLP